MAHLRSHSSLSSHQSRAPFPWGPRCCRVGVEDKPRALAFCFLPLLQGSSPGCFPGSDPVAGSGHLAAARAAGILRRNVCVHRHPLCLLKASLRSECWVVRPRVHHSPFSPSASSAGPPTQCQDPPHFLVWLAPSPRLQPSLPEILMHMSV